MDTWIFIIRDTKHAFKKSEELYDIELRYGENLYAIFFENVGQLSRSFLRMTGCEILIYHAG
jgi:hypothetical protein